MLAATLFGGAAVETSSAANLAPLFPAETLPKRPQSPPVQRKPVLLRADEVTYDQNNDIITATGHVEFTQNDRVLLADTISYNQKSDIVTANGHVTLMEPTGDVYFGDFIELTTDFHDAIIKNFRMLMFDNSRLAANSAVRVDGDRKVLVRGAFSPCELCKGDPTAAPEWQVKARRIIHDETEHEVRYYDATMEVRGVPIIYTPYFSHPDPSIKRKSGFLFPSAGDSSSLGAFFGIPYYGVINDSSDFTLEPRYFSNEGGGVAGEYRQRFSNGFVRFAGTGTDARKFDPILGQLLSEVHKVRGNIAATSEFDFDDEFRGGLEFARATDATYISRFRVGNQFSSVSRYNEPNELVSDAYVEGFRDRDYLLARSFWFQTLRQGVSNASVPRVHPDVNYTHYGDADAWGGHFVFNENVLSISRAQGTDSSRLASTSGYYLPFKTADGSVFSAAATFEADGYHTSQLAAPTPSDANHVFSGYTGRVHPQAALRWDFPVVKSLSDASLLVQPTVQIVGGPRGDNPARISNEDSQEFEFDEVNLFALQRYPGHDRISSGSRVDYGLLVGDYGRTIGSADVFIGQSIRDKTDSTYPVNSGLNSQVSDYVGRAAIHPQEWLDLSYRFRLARQGLTPARQEATASLFNYGGAISLSYLDFARAPTAQVTNSLGQVTTVTLPLEELQVAATAPFFTYYVASLSVAEDVQSNKIQSEQLSLTYRDECFAAEASYVHSGFSYADIRSTDTFLLRLGFKYLGDIGS